MGAPRRVIALPSDAKQRQRLVEISRSRTEPTSRVERARIILAYLEDPSAYAVARTIGVTQQTVTRCLERAAELRVIEALDDRPRAGRDPVITAEAKTWLVALACRKAKELGYPHELWTTRLLAAHARQHGSSVGHPSLGKLAQGTVCKILAEQEVKPHKSLPSRRRGRYYLEQRDPEFEPKMAEILCVYRQVAMLRCQAECGEIQGQDSGGGSLAIVSYDEKPGIQAIGTIAPDRPPLPGVSPTVMRDHEYKHHGTLTLMAGIDLLTGHVKVKRPMGCAESQFVVSRETWAEWLSRMTSIAVSAG
jgi:transposase